MRRHAPAWAEWGLSVMNGLFGDHLSKGESPLAIDMAAFHEGRRIKLTRESLLAAHPKPTGKICILLHGFACNEGVWMFRHPEQPDLETSYGLLLQQELGYTPFHLRYNTGLPLAENGLYLSTWLDELAAHYPVPIEEIVLIGHSMGGLIVRSACQYGTRRESEWIDRVSKIFYLGSPHDGVALVQLGFTVTNVLRAIPGPITRWIADLLDWTSQGVKDMRYSVPLFSPEEEIAQETVCWHKTAKHYFIAAALTSDPQHPVARILGDGLVGLASAHSPCTDSSKSRLIPGCQVKIFPGMAHLRLTCDKQVYSQIKEWCQGE